MLSSFSSRVSSRTGLNCFSKVGFRLRAASTFCCPLRESSSSAAQDNHQGQPGCPKPLLPKPHRTQPGILVSSLCTQGHRSPLSVHPRVLLLLGTTAADPLPTFRILIPCRSGPPDLAQPCPILTERFQAFDSQLSPDSRLFPGFWSSRPPPPPQL